MDRTTQRLVAAAAIIAPGLHTLTDGMEWLQGGFSPVQLWLNYLAFVPVPAVLLGLYAAQRPRITQAGLVGALLYGFSFVYFTHTTLLALMLRTATYEQLWSNLGWVYTAHGALMIIGGACFGWATVRARVLPRWTAWLFLGGLVLNLGLGLLPVPAGLQTVGTAIRNAGLMGMGWSVSRLRQPTKSGR
jgi:hypothetical protein